MRTVLIAMLASSVAACQPEDTVFREEFGQIRIGMLESEVRAVIGFPAHTTNAEVAVGFTGYYAQRVEASTWPAKGWW